MHINWFQNKGTLKKVVLRLKNLEVLRKYLKHCNNKLRLCLGKTKLTRFQNNNWTMLGVAGIIEGIT